MCLSFIKRSRLLRNRKERERTIIMYCENSKGNEANEAQKSGQWKEHNTKEGSRKQTEAVINIAHERNITGTI